MRGYILKCGFASIALTLLSVVSLPSGVFALGTPSAITTSPIFVDLSGTPGTPVSTNLQVQNNTTSPVTISVRLDKFTANGVNGQASFYTPTAGDPSASWVHFSKNNFVAQPAQWANVTMTIDLPKTATLGYYYAVLFSANNSTHSTSQSATLKSANAVFVLLNTNSSNETKSLKVVSFTASKSLYDFLPATFNVVVKNSGNIFLAPQGDIYISTKPGGKTIDALPINANLNNVLPNSSRKFSATWSNGFPVYQTKRINGVIQSNKKGQPIESLNWNFSKPLSDFRFGKYYANLVMVYSNGSSEIPINAVVSFWVIPVVLIIEVIVGIVLVITAIVFFIKYFRRGWRKVFKSTKQKEAPARKQEKNQNKPD